MSSLPSTRIFQAISEKRAILRHGILGRVGDVGQDDFRKHLPQHFSQWPIANTGPRYLPALL